MLNKEVEKFVERYRKYQEGKEEAEENEGERIHVDEIASKVASFYEKVRNIIEYRDAHLLRKNAIERALRRRIFLKDFREDFAEPLIKELIRSGHLANDTVPETKIAEVQRIIDNLLTLLKLTAASESIGRDQNSEWLVRMAAARIEEALFRAPETALLSEMMYGVMKKNMTLRNIPLSPDEANVQLFVAVQRALWRPDDNQLRYLLLKIMYPEWGTFSKEGLEEVAPNVRSVRMMIEKILRNPYAPYFYKVANHEKILFQLIGDLVLENVSLENVDDVASSLKFRYDKRYFKASGQMRRLAFVSVLSFLITKLAIALAIEMPLDQYLYHTVSLTSLAVNVTFPPLLMLIIVATTKLPSKNNFALVEAGTKQILFEEDAPTYVIAAPKKKSFITNTFVYAAYIAVLLVILYYITKILLYLHFSPASIVIFLLFTSMVTATGVKVKNRAKEMSLEKEKTSFSGFIVDLITVPFMTIGQWTIAGVSRFNVIVIAFDFLIELPFQFFVEFLENFRSFISAKKDEMH